MITEEVRYKFNLTRKNPNGHEVHIADASIRTGSDVLSASIGKFYVEINRCDWDAIRSGLDELFFKSLTNGSNQ